MTEYKSHGVCGIVRNRERENAQIADLKFRPTGKKVPVGHDPVKTGTELFALKTRSPFVWSPCSCVRSTPASDLASMPWVFKCQLILFALNPISIKTAVSPAWIRVTFPALLLARIVTRMVWFRYKKDARKCRFYRFYGMGGIKNIFVSRARWLDGHF